MANFKTHITVAALGGVLTAGLGWQAGLWSLPDAAALGGLTTLGGIMPDIDADYSRSIRLIFTLLAVLAVIAAVMMLQSQLPMATLVLVAGGLYLAVRYPLSTVFRRLTTHRGIWHSLTAVALMSLLVTAGAFQLLAQSPWQAWCQGGAMGLGMLIHLLLDECYSIDLAGSRLKRSFGTAFKLYDYHAPATAVAMLLLIAGLLPWLPPWQVLGNLGARVQMLWPGLL
ncbi:LexA-binding, inner membrane-associated putative hydrolase [Kushneria sinocarnis]|uniref:LexA-binding, inner membrane-associated putative hydrolase n=1 Tax=Kushneria sinocarnis TaxID=595502 RepID=A0A420WVX1_9GAMM|nr:metal-dependent hydrolase [Kushneria sinocarnis]RKR03243.1 LexA-binding, inner membrane-associated putative hydrolase [Kushneria sinocarnis]